MTFIELLRGHVKTPFMTAFAYGSGVFKQSEGCGFRVIGNKMVDYLVVVEDHKLTEWHQDNCEVNPGDYTFLGRLAMNKSKIFDESVYYVPSVTVSGDKKIKYGALGLGTMIRDLFTWETMFLAGRLQKPTLRYDITSIDSDSLTLAMEYNYDSALRTSILLNPRADFIKILKGIVSLSYTNDPRMLLAESPQKVENIVRGQMKELEALYLERYESMKRRESFDFGDPLVRLNLLNNLPLKLKSELLSDSPSLWHVALNEGDNLLLSALGRIVRRSAWKQMILGFVSTPIDKAAKYALDKVKKRFKK